MSEKVESEIVPMQIAAGVSPDWPQCVVMLLNPATETEIRIILSEECAEALMEQIAARLEKIRESQKPKGSPDDARPIRLNS